MSNARFHRVPTKCTPYVWHHVKPLIDKGLDIADYEITTPDYIDFLLSGSCVLFIGLVKDFTNDFKSLNDGDVKSMVIADCTKYPRTNVLQIHLWATTSGRDYQLWVDQFPTIEQWGRDRGCTVTTALCRKGLAKKLSQLSGWTEEAILLYKDL
jgi:hypothetical protein